MVNSNDTATEVRRCCGAAIANLYRSYYLVPLSSLMAFNMSDRLQRKGYCSKYLINNLMRKIIQ